MVTATLRRNRSEKAAAGDENPIDRISNLPEDIMHHVISFLPTEDATRTSVLSKRFRSTWTSFPIIDFNEALASSFLRKSDGNGRELHLDFMLDSLHRRGPNKHLQKFRMHAFVDNTKSDHRIDKAINYALESNLKELDIHIHSWNSSGKFTYNFPLILFPTKSVTLLKLQGCNLKNLDLTKFSSVKELRLKHCDGLRSLKVSNPLLEILKVHNCDDLLQIDIEKSNLRSFSFKGKSSIANAEELQLNLAGANSLYNIKLQKASIASVDHASELHLLENLTLKDCNTLTEIRIRSPSLKELEIRNCSILEKIAILAPNLESFAYEKGSRRVEILISACKLKKLELFHAYVTDEWVEKNIPEFPSLEILILSHCHLLKRIRISHEQLKSFQLLRCPRLEEAEICCGNPVFFRYNGRASRSLKLLIDSPSLEAELTLDINPLTPTNAECYKELRDFLGCFDHCKLLTINCTPLQFLIFPEDLRENLLPPLFDIKYLKVKMNSTQQDVTTLAKSLLWLCPLLETMSIVSNFRENTIEFEYAKSKMMEAEEATDMKLSCCQTRIIKCWRHCLSKVSMTNFDHRDNEKLIEYFRGEARLKTLEITQTTSGASKLKQDEDDDSDCECE